MRRIAAVLLMAAAGLLAQGCVLVVATAAGAAALTATAVKTTTKVTTATVAATGRVTAAAITSSGEVTALTIESAARLAKAGMVVLVDAGAGTIAEVPWSEGLELHGALQASHLRAAIKAVRIFRDGRMISRRLRSRQTVGRGPQLAAGDVVELLR
jgi:hypothetical protein